MFKPKGSFHFFRIYQLNFCILFVFLSLLSLFILLSFIQFWVFGCIIYEFLEHSGHENCDIQFSGLGLYAAVLHETSAIHAQLACEKRHESTRESSHDLNAKLDICISEELNTDYIDMNEVFFPPLFSSFYCVRKRDNYFYKSRTSITIVPTIRVILLSQKL